MAEPNSVQDLTDAAQSARQNVREMVREMRASRTQPLGGKPIGPAERRQRYFALSRDPMQLNSEFDFLRDRFELTNPDKPIPRRLWDSLRAGKTEFEKEED